MTEITTSQFDLLPLHGTNAWLVDQGVGDVGLAEIVRGLGQNLVERGIALHRIAVGGMLLHPVFGARDVIWDARSDHVKSEMATRNIIHSEEFQNSPFFNALSNGLPFERYRLDGEESLPFPILDTLRDEGVTDYLVFYRDYGRRGLTLWEGLPQGLEGTVTSFSTRRLSGFTDEEVAYLTALNGLLTLIVKTKTTQELSMTLLETYLGTYSGGHVMDGLVERGDGRRIECVIWQCDLRGSTALAETLPMEDYLATLDAYFDCTAGVVLEHGGEVLKFIGDGVLAIFPVDTETRRVESMCRSAISTAREALERAARMNTKREGSNMPPIKFGMSLHVGEVVYGNVGTDRRLDFTVIGSAVNEAARLEGLTKNLDVPVVASAKFADAAPETLVTLGAHKVPGVSGELEAFTLPELTAS
ncbi:MAG: adenylate/guanylate cyclase domain-containing protein [Rhodospirillaceae bacterium]|nr:adenylate/guanylate cyclase domain-containing protein [Rhodospirillaceae bacterium]MBT3808361.1 adenylate/guanylate cyclase domain-containing protein [Rhodospirillaceae bacterium]MBT3931534.1 adenylate/guanylate cyclase domain-containing protein [Rhodospirillaceae bacterium]MBT4772599.1 adenylate/guanylate cyclase domain-containing protein [Rhodospirillaceae bacterium]MBT5359024.1 adenylate/guanylate cyclase domain-containing protein [Rhodospirillaceae bacterium]